MKLFGGCAFSLSNVSQKQPSEGSNSTGGAELSTLSAQVDHVFIRAKLKPAPFLNKTGRPKGDPYLPTKKGIHGGKKENPLGAWLPRVSSPQGGGLLIPLSFRATGLCEERLQGIFTNEVACFHTAPAFVHSSCPPTP